MANHTHPEFGLTASLYNVQDGDTLTVVDWPVHPVLQRIRLADIDAPERGECLAAESRILLARLAASAPLMLEEPDMQCGQLTACNRTVRYLWAGDLLINAAMCHEGLAVIWTPRGRSQHYERMAAAQRVAMEAKRGVWALENHRLTNLQPI